MVDRACLSRLIEIAGSGKMNWESIKSTLEEHGIDLQACCDSEGKGGARVKVVCVAPDLKETVEEMGRAPRDQVVMVRVDEETSRTLDAWVESGAVKSRSEAAALFIREGLKVRSSELEQLRDALREVDDARTRLHARAREVFGSSPEAAS